MISVCVPYWERQEALDRMFANYAQHYGKLPIEFSVCDDGSPTPAIHSSSGPLTRLPAKDRPLNPCVPINRAVAASHGEIIVLTNPEIEHRGPILEEMLTLLKSDKDYVIACCRDTRKNAWFAGPQVDYRRRGRLPVPVGGHFHFLTMLRRSLWDLAGGFDEEYRNGIGCDDNDWLWRLCAAGAQFKTTIGVVWHQQTKPIRWDIPHNRSLFLRKWPEEKRAALPQGLEWRGEQYPPPEVLHPEWALILGGATAVWDEVLAWEEIYGKTWDGLVIAANDVGSHWPRHLDHWCTLHPEKMESWKKARAGYGLSDGYQTWGRRTQTLDHQVRPWAGGSSGMLAIQIASELGCVRAVLCGIPMTPTPHFIESTVHPNNKKWTAVAGHWRAWVKHMDRMRGWVKSMSGETQVELGAPTLEWLLEGIVE